MPGSRMLVNTYYSSRRKEEGGAAAHARMDFSVSGVSSPSPFGTGAAVLTSTRGPTGCNRRAADPQPTAALRQPGLVVRGLRRGVALAVRGVLRSYNRLTIVGRENLPADGPFVLVANHSSHLDVLCLLA